jgi:hypothetical protein
MLRTDRWVSDAEQVSERLEGWRLMQEALLHMRQEAATFGAQLVVVLIPSKEEVYWDVVREDVPVAAEEIDRPLSLVDEFCNARDIPVCDLRPAFERQAAEYRQLYLRVSGHWNEAGNVLAADTISACLRSRGLLSGEMEGDGAPRLPGEPNS